MFQVGEVSRRLNLNPQTLYFYERIGLIPSPERSATGYRIFSEKDIQRIAFITHAKSLGLTLDEIKDILALQDGEALTCQALYERLNQKVQEIQAKIQKLQKLHDDLLPLLAECEKNLEHPNPRHQCLVLTSTLSMK